VFALLFHRFDYHRALPMTDFLSKATRIAAGLLSVCWLACGALCHADESKRPHIIFLLTDDLGAGDIGCYGGKLTPTPNIDRLASEGTKFAQYYAPAPTCSPSRCGLITGTFPGRWQITSFLQTRKGNRECEQVDALDPAAPSLPRILKQSGYATAHIGKWHLGGGRDVQDAPKFAAYGYDEGVGTYESPEPHPDITATNWIWSDKDKVKRWERTGFFVDKTLDFLKRHPDQPCFVNLWLDDPHTPWVPDEDASPQGDTREKLAKVMAQNDKEIGRLLRGVPANTLIIFASDNGPLPHFQRERTQGLRGAKLSLYEGGIRMPLIAWWPGKVPAGRHDETTVLSGVDMLPTLCAIAGAKVPEDIKLDGEDLSAALLGKSQERTKPIYWEYGRNDTSFRYPPQKLDRSPNVAMRDGNWKLLVNADGTRRELYDLAADPQETKNLAAARPRIAERLSKQALAWRKSLPSFQTAASTGPPRPNLVLFLIDDLSWSDCSIHNPQSGIGTPNMERIAAAGMSFSHAFIASPSCAPSRGALLTGLNPIRNGAMFNHTVPDQQHKRWPAWFQELGYEVVAIGKVAHYATVQQYGFDHASHFKYHEDDCIEAAVKWLDERKSDKPLCLLVGTNWPHVPWPEKTTYDPNKVPLPPTQVDNETTRQWRARYAEAVANADRDLGIIYDVTRKKLGDNTLFLFTSDHGSQFPFGKWNCYDEGIRTPLVAVWPGKIAAGSKSAALVTWTDLLPTCLTAAGGEPPPSGDKAGTLSGRSFLPVLRGEQKTHWDLVFATHSGDGKMNEYPMRAVRSRDWKYIQNLAPDAEFHSHVDLAERDGYWSSWVETAKTSPEAAAIVARYHTRPAEELYDLASDPHELKNLATSPQHAAKLQELRAALREWSKAQGDEGLVTEQARKPKPR
jgi:arylsulfatase A-like enzyme